MAIRVPVNPQTRVASSSPTYQRGGDIFPDNRILAEALASYAEVERDRRLARENFDVDKAALEEANFRQEDFNSRVQQADLGADGFVERVTQDYRDRTTNMLQQFKERGYSRSALQNLELKLGSFNLSYAGKAIEFKEKSELARDSSSVLDYESSSSAYAFNNPDAIEATLEQFRGGVFSLGTASPEEKDNFYRRGERSILQSASRGLALKDPTRIIQAFAPQELARTRTVTSSGGDAFDLQSYKARTRVIESSGSDTAKAPTSSAYGRYQFTKSTWLGYYKQIFGETGESEKQILAKRADGDLQEKLMDALTQDNADALKAAGVPVTNASVYLAHFLGASDAIKLLQSKEGTPVSQVINAQSIAANPRVLKNKNTEEVVIEAVRKFGGEVQTSTETEVPEASDWSKDPILSRLTGEEQAQALAMARSEYNRTKVDNRAAVSVAVDNANAVALETGEVPTTLDRDGIIDELGPVQAEQVIRGIENSARAGQIRTNVKTQSVAQAVAEVEALKPTDVNSPTYARDMELYRKAGQAVNAELEDRAKDPAAYVLRNYPNIQAKFANGETLSARRDAYIALNQAFDQLAIPQEQRYPFSIPRIKQIAEQYTTLDPAAKFSAIEGWRQELQGTGLYNGFLQQVSRSGKGFGQDNLLAEILRGTQSYTDTMLDYLKGRNDIALDPAKRPSREKLNSSFAESVGAPAMRDLNPATSAVYNEAAQAIYVANGGRTDGSMGANFDKKLFIESLRQAVGGTSGDANTGWFSNAGWFGSGVTTILPAGTTRQQWDGWISRLTPGDLTRLSVAKQPPLDKFGNPAGLRDLIDSGSFVQVAINQYAIRGKDGGYYTTRSGDKFVVTITSQTLRGR